MGARMILVILIVAIFFGSNLDNSLANYQEHYAEIETIVCQAVQDEGWLEAESAEELLSFFSQLFIDELAVEITNDTWTFFINPTAFVHQAKVTQLKTIIFGEHSYTIAHLELYHTGSTEPELIANGMGYFNLSLVDNQWRITTLEFDWDYLDDYH